MVPARFGPTATVTAAHSWLADAAMPVLSIAIRPKSKADEDKLMTALHRLQEEDPTLVVRRDDETHQTVLSGTGEAHLAHRHGDAWPASSGSVSRARSS